MDDIRYSVWKGKCSWTHPRITNEIKTTETDTVMTVARMGTKYEEACKQEQRIKQEIERIIDEAEAEERQDVSSRGSRSPELEKIE